jgi:hypothetical protein
MDVTTPREKRGRHSLAIFYIGVSERSQLSRRRLAPHRWSEVLAPSRTRAMGRDTDFSDFGRSLSPGIHYEFSTKLLAFALLLHRAFHFVFACDANNALGD